MSAPREEHLGVLIAAARRSIKRAVVARLEQLALDPPLFWTLLAVREQPGSSLGELAQRQLVDLPSMSRIVARLSRRGLVALKRDEADRRRGRIELTSAGTQLASRAQRVADEVRAAIAKDLSSRQQAALREGLRHVIDNLERLDAEPRRRVHA